MRFIDLETGAAFDPTSTTWPEKACVQERFVRLRICRHGDHVVAEEPKLCWELTTFMEAVSNNDGMKNLLSKAINAIPIPDEFYGNLRYALWFSEKHDCIFQFAYSELEANIYSWDPYFQDWHLKTSGASFILWLEKRKI